MGTTSKPILKPEMDSSQKINGDTWWIIRNLGTYPNSLRVTEPSPHEDTLDPGLCGHTTDRPSGGAAMALPSQPGPPQCNAPPLVDSLFHVRRSKEAVSFMV